MARGLFSGILVGAVVAGLGLAGLSVAYRDVGPFSAPAPVATTSGPVGAQSGSEEAAPEAPGMQAPASVATPSPASPEAAPPSEAPPQLAVASPMPEVDIEASQVPPGATSEAAPALNRGAAAPEGTAPVNVAVNGAVPEAPRVEAQPMAEARPTNPEVQAELAPASAAPAPGQGPAPIAGEHEGAPMPAAPANVRPGAPEAPPAPVPPARLVPGGGPAIPGAEAGQIGDIAENVVTGRLPSIGNAPAPDGEAQAAPLPAIQRNRAAFDYNGQQPLMAVVLLDVGAERADLGDLKNLPFAISFAVDVAAPDAEEAVAFYRNAGAEVVLELALPTGATPSDVETTFAAYQDLLGQGVAVMMARESGFQTLGDAARQVVQILAAQGLGLISFPQGLNTGHKMALREGVAAGLIFRELDNDGQTSAVMRRFLDNAAFKARQNKGVIMLGHARAQTIQALIEWSLGSRAKTVTLAPVSVVLQDR